VYLETKTKQRNTKKKRVRELLQNKQDPTTQQQAAAKNSAKSFAGSSPSSLTNHTPIQETQNGGNKKQHRQKRVLKRERERERERNAKRDG
jgi:hypothetical protein